MDIKFFYISHFCVIIYILHFLVQSTTNMEAYMRTEHIILALNIARENSISKAAEALYISQPNASNMLKALEKELGYALFERTPTGMRLTEKGKAFVELAATIERSLQAISQIPDPVKQISLRIFTLQFDFTELAFEKFCRKYCADHFVCDLSLKNVDNIEEARKAIENGKGDLAIALCQKQLYESVLRYAKRKHIDTEIIGYQHLEVTCKKGHPIIKGGKIASGLFREYQAFTGIHAIISNLYAPYYFSRHNIDVSSFITMGPTSARYRLLNETNGYLINIPVPEDVKKEYDLESVPIKSSELVVFAAYHKEARRSDMIKEYIGYCREFLKTT